MLKKMSLLMLMAIFSQISYSQINYGIKAGLNYSNVVLVNTPENSDNYFKEIGSKYNLGYHFGLFSSYKINERFSINPELLFSVKGSKKDKTAISPLFVSKSYYINLPLLIGFKPINKLTILAGPELGYLLYNKTTVNNLTTDNTELYNKIDFGFAIGLRYQLSKKAMLDLRYSQSIPSISKLTYLSVRGELLDAVKEQNRTFQLSFLYQIK